VQELKAKTTGTSSYEVKYAS